MKCLLLCISQEFRPLFISIPEGFYGLSETQHLMVVNIRDTHNLGYRLGHPPPHVSKVRTDLVKSNCNVCYVILVLRTITLYRVVGNGPDKSKTQNLEGRCL
jgi:hypothetical protein